MNDLTNNLLKKIKDGEVAMVPRWHFVLRAALFAFGTLISLMVAVYLLSFIFFALSRSGVLFAPLYGRSGLVLFVVSSPWLLISLTGLFLLVLYVLISHYSFSYKKPLVYSMVGVVFLVVAVSSLLHQAAMHERVQNFAERNQVPGLGPMYEQVADRRSEAVTRGTILEFNEAGFSLESITGQVHQVDINSQTKLPRGRELQPGDTVLIFGPHTDSAIDAFGIRPAGERRSQQSSQF